MATLSHFWPPPLPPKFFYFPLLSPDAEFSKKKKEQLSPFEHAQLYVRTFLAGKQRGQARAEFLHRRNNSVELRRLKYEEKRKFNKHMKIRKLDGKTRERVSFWRFIRYPFS